MRVNGFLSSNVLKIIALISMTIDHMGLILFPNIIIFRCIGRIAFPVFAYFIAEGAYYTKNYFKYFIKLFIFGLLFFAVYFFVFKLIYFSIFIGFSLSLILIYIYKMFLNEKRNFNKIIYIILILFLIVNIYILCEFVKIDYGFIGVIIPFILYLVKYKNIKLMVLLVMLLINCFFFNKHTLLNMTLYSLISIPLLSLYNGKRGKYNLKYLFYYYYPIHLVLLYLIKIIIR